ncbi:MAG: pyruvate carboxylase, partial [Planctomycetota bacterium]
FTGAIITPYFDSLLVKVTASGTHLPDAIARMDRALREFRVRGVKTNIPFLENLIRHPTFVDGKTTTRFVDETPGLFDFQARRDRATKLLEYLGDVIVNGRDDVRGKADARVLPEPIVPAFEKDDVPAKGTRDRLLADGPTKFAEWTRKQKRLLLTDTTFRDAHQSLLSTRVRTYDLLQIAEAMSHLAPHLWSIEMWGGATFDTSMRFLQESPWDRLAQLRKAIPNVCFQMLLRASNAVGYTNYADNVVQKFVDLSAEHGMDVFRVFDSLNNVTNMKVAMKAVLDTKTTVCEAAVCYTGDILDPARSKYDLDYYVDMAKQLEDLGAHVLCVKDMAGLLKPYAATVLFKALRKAVNIPVHFHTHDTSGVNSSSILRAADAGVDVADAAIAAMSGTTSQPNLNSIAAALRHTPRDTGLPAPLLEDVNFYWEQARQLYYPFEQNVMAGTADVYRHEMPGGQYTNLRVQAQSLGLGDRWDDIADAYATVNRMFGDIVKVTPSSKVVGDMALFMVTNGLTEADVMDASKKLSFPQSVVDAMAGLIGTPPGGWPKKLRKIILDSAGRAPIKGRPGATLPKVDFDQSAADLSTKLGRAVTDTDVISAELYPAVFADFDRHQQTYSDTSVLPTPNFFFGLQRGEEVAIEIEAGKTLIVKFLAEGDARDDGTRVLFFELNGQPREVVVVDRSLESSTARREKADPDDPSHIAAPMPGKITEVVVKAGAAVAEGERVLSIEAMKMETAVYSPIQGKVAAIHAESGDTVQAGDLLAVVT